MALTLKGYEGQATVSVALAGAAGLLALGGTFLVLQRFNWDNFAVFYAPGTMRMPLILGLLGLAAIGSGVGVLLGINSANQKRNKSAGTAWMGFFLNTGVLTLALSSAAFFWATKLAAK